MSNGTEDCPICGGENTLSEESPDEYSCSERCDLSDYHKCPECNNWYTGNLGYCEECIQEV